MTDENDSDEILTKESLRSTSCCRRSSRRRDRASREEYNDLLAFYKGADFDHDRINDRFTWFPPRRTQ
jgi:hypothetical protein